MRHDGLFRRTLGLTIATSSMLNRIRYAVSEHVTLSPSSRTFSIVLYCIFV